MFMQEGPRDFFLRFFAVGSLFSLGGKQGKQTLFYGQRKSPVYSKPKRAFRCKARDFTRAILNVP